jgi:chloramphenicol-sensitive protein RarD
MSGSSLGKGFFFSFLAFFLWGIFPLYWKLLIAVDSLHILAFRILLSLILVGIILFVQKNYRWLVMFKEPKKAVFLVLTALTISCNWGLYIWAINQGHTIEASLGYYINPLVTIVLGLVFFRERLRPLQWAAVAVAVIGVLILTILSGALPWISLALALTFGFYGLLKKKHTLTAIESLGAETLTSAPIGFLLLCFSFGSARGPVFSGLQGLAYLSELPVYTWVVLSLAGVMTMLPLYFFARGAKMIPLSALGFTQFISPTIQFVLGLFVFGETFSTHYFIAFTFIWSAVILYIISLKRV